MRKIVLVGMMAFFCSHLFGQTKKDPAVIEYIRSKKYFIPLTDTANLPLMIRPYCDGVFSFMSEHRMDKNDYYVSINHIKNQAVSLSIPIIHYDGFKKLKEEAGNDRDTNKNEIEGQFVYSGSTTTGNLSGKDGTLEIDKNTKRVLSFKIWQ